MKKLTYAMLENNEVNIKEEDLKIVMDHLIGKNELTIDENNKIYNESGIYIADIEKNIGEKQVFYNDELVGSVTSNHSMTDEEVVEFALGLTSLDNQEELEELYNKNVEYVYFSDNEKYEIDLEALEIKH